MSSVVISGDTSGAITVSAPLVAGTNTLTLQAGTATNSMNTLATAVASTSGTSVDFTGLPSWIKRITVMFTGVSHNGSTAANDQLIIQIGSGSITSSGYVSICVGTSATTGFLLTNSISGAATFSGVSVISLIGSNTYAQFGNLSGNGTCQYGAGSVALGGALDRVRITTVGGTDTFDAGTINILYEG